MATRTVEDVLGDLTETAERRRTVQAEERALFARMVDLYVELREGFEEPVIKRVIAEAAGGTLVAVDAALTKRGEQLGRRIR